uniref:Integrase catalytic domain-containing protein n=1 Tax=Eptatretus burgeri TaxID=7764 RepID=A0A8C4NL68_EPTBU
MIKHCTTCQSDADNLHQASCLWPIPDRPWQRIHVDFAGPFKGKVFLVVVDAFSKWQEVVVMQCTTAENTVEKLHTIFANKGIPEVLVSDNGPQFIAGVFDNFMIQNGVKHLKSAPYHPATNGQAESFVKMLKRALRRGEGASMQAMVDVFLLYYRNAVHPTTGDTPAMHLYGRALRSRLDLLRPGRSGPGAVSQPMLIMLRPFSSRRKGVRAHGEKNNKETCASVRVFAPFLLRGWHEKGRGSSLQIGGCAV